MQGKELFEILVCPQCKGGLTPMEGGSSLACRACRLKYPVRDGIPVMLVDEALDMKGGRAHQTAGAEAGRAKAAVFGIVSGPNKGLTFHLERSTCKVIGRAISDPNKTAVFNVDVSLALDEGTKGLVQHYIARQFKETKGEIGDTGRFKRTSDVILDDMSISRLHSMIFYGDAGVGILDLVSKNGTFVNGEEVESRLLQKGDAIEMGETKIVFEG